MSVAARKTLDEALRLQTLRVVHHKLFGTWPQLWPVLSKTEWQASSDESSKTVYGSGDTECEALISLIHNRIAGSFGHAYEKNLRP
jgi:transposase